MSQLLVRSIRDYKSLLVLSDIARLNWFENELYLMVFRYEMVTAHV